VLGINRGRLSRNGDSTSSNVTSWFDRPFSFYGSAATIYKLRDGAMALTRTGKQFSVDYDSATRNIPVASGKPYSPSAVN
jgi:hypothetical protein